MDGYKTQVNMMKTIGICGIIGFLILMLTLIAVTFIKMNIDFSVGVINFILLVCIAFSGFIAGNLSGQIQKENGLILGASCGLVIFVILLICGLVYNLIAFNFITSVKLIVLIFCSTLGGILGVNKKEKRINIKNKSKI